MPEANVAVSAPVTPTVAPTTTAPVTPNGQANGKGLPPTTAESLEAMKKSAHQKFDEASKARKEAADMKAEAEKIKQEAMSSKAEMDRFIELAKTNPKALIKIYGEEAAIKIAEDLLYHDYEEKKLTPEQKAARDKKAADDAELEEYRNEKKTRTEREAQEKLEATKAEQAQYIDTFITDAIKEHGLEQTPRIVKRISSYLRSQLNAEVPMTAARVVEKVHEELHNDAVGYIKDMPIERLIEEFPTLVSQIREFDMRKNDSVPSFQTGFANPQSDGEKPKQPEKKKTIDEFFKGIG